MSVSAAARAAAAQRWPGLRRAAAWLHRRHWVVLLLAAPLLLFPQPATTPALLVVPGLWLAAAAAGAPALPRTPLNGALLLLGASLCLSLFATYDLAVSLGKIAGLVLGLGLFFAAARTTSARGLGLVLLALAAAGGGVAALSLVATDWQDKFALLASLTARLPPLVRGLPGVEEGFSPNQVAGTLLWVLPLTAVLAGLAWRRWAWFEQAFGAGLMRWLRPALALLAAFQAGVFVLTQSRTALGALAATAALGALVVVPRRWGRRGWWALLAAAVVALLAAAMLRERLAFELGRAGVLAVRPDSVEVGTLRGRLELWARALEAIALFPWTGLGLNTFRTVGPALFPLWLSPPGYDIAHAHNELLQAALDLGLPGLVAFAALHLAAAWTLWQVVRAPTGTGDAWPGWLRRWLASALAAGLLAHFLFGLADAIALGAKPGAVFWLMLGASVSLWARTRRYGGV